MDTFPNRSSNRTRRIIVFTAITSLSLFFLLMLIPHSPIPFPHNIPMPVCTMEHRLERTFTKHDEYYDLSSSNEANWSSLVPVNGGFIVQKNEQGGYEMAGITMFHQLHCIQMIRKAFNDLEVEATQPRKRNDIHGEDEAEKASHPSQRHWVHCLDYLMQGILCAADDTIEPAHDKEGGGRVVDGYGVNHICRDPDQLWYSVMGKKSRPGWSRQDELIA